jgi:hypothetical protein
MCRSWYYTQSFKNVGHKVRQPVLMKYKHVEPIRNFTPFLRFRSHPLHSMWRLKKKYHIHILVDFNFSMDYLRLESKVYQLHTWNILLSLSSLMFPRPYRATAVEPCNAIHKNTSQNKKRFMTILLFSYPPPHFSVWISSTVLNNKPSL